MQKQHKALKAIPCHSSSERGDKNLCGRGSSELNAQVLGSYGVSSKSGWWILPSFVGGFVVWALIGKLVFSWL
jgi:hypothetical protein